jgi:uncharacterized protein YcfJ
MQEIANNTTLITEDQKVYDEMIQTLIESKENNVPIDEGVLKAILGGVAGATVGPAIMKAVCKVLGISEGGALGNLMTSRLILTALAGYLGYKN